MKVLGSLSKKLDPILNFSPYVTMTRYCMLIFNDEKMKLKSLLARNKHIRYHLHLLHEYQFKM